MKVSLENISHSFGAKPVLNQIDIEVPAGEVFSLIGPNGAGKTTTMRLIYGDLKLQNGKITIDGNVPDTKLKERIAVMTEDRVNFGRFKGEDYVRFWKMLYPGWKDKVFSSFATHYRFDLDQRVSTYSMGTKTLFNLALCLSTGADLLILDEPTQNLDPIIRAETLSVIRDFVNSENKTVIISSHEIYELEEISTSFAIIREGDVLYSDTIDEAKEKHRMVESGEKVPVGNVIGVVNNQTLLRTEEEIGSYPTFNQIVLGYLQGRKSFIPFQ